MSQFLSIKAAYGRRYAIHREALADWNIGKDFKIFDGPYCSIRDINAMRQAGYIGVAILSDRGYSIVNFADIGVTA